MKKTIMIALGAALATNAAAADPSKEELEVAAAAAAEVTAEARGDNAYVCKKVAVRTGTRLGRKRQICMTQNDWDARGEELGHTLREHQRLGLQTRGE